MTQNDKGHLALCERMIERFRALLRSQLDGAGKPFAVNHVEWLTANLDRWIAERNHMIVLYTGRTCGFGMSFNGRIVV